MSPQRPVFFLNDRNNIITPNAEIEMHILLTGDINLTYHPTSAGHHETLQSRATGQVQFLWCIIRHIFHFYHTNPGMLSHFQFFQVATLQVQDLQGWTIGQRERLNRRILDRGSAQPVAPRQVKIPKIGPVDDQTIQL